MGCWHAAWDSGSPGRYSKFSINQVIGISQAVIAALYSRDMLQMLRMRRNRRAVNLSGSIFGERIR